MSYWNPQNKKVLYFHVCRKDDDFYLRVNCERQEVYKLQLHPTIQRGQEKMRGLYQLKWSTFATGYMWNLKPKNIDHIKLCEKKDGSPRTRIKHTSENQWNIAMEAFMKSV